MDLTLSSIGLIALFPLLLAVGIAIRLDSPGPALFRHTRVGRAGRHFQVLKFRTMRTDSEHLSRETLGTHDPRITRIGGFLRRCKLDEFPQLINVIRGEMSLVGPRPEIPHYVNTYSEEQRKVLSVRPGITDPSSIELCHLDEIMASRGSESASDFYARVILPKKLALQSAYLARRSLKLDILVILNTFVRIFRGTR